MASIRKSAAENKINVLLGLAENDGNSVYIAQALIGADGEIKMRRRKVKPTHMERTVFGDGSGSSLKNVVKVDGVGRVGSLACWEHTQPLLKYHTYLQREEIHVAAWPPLDPHPGGPGLWSMSKEGEYCHIFRLGRRLLTTVQVVKVYLRPMPSRLRRSCCIVRRSSRRKV